MREEYIVLMSSNNNQYLGLFTDLQQAKDSIVKQYKQIGICTFTNLGSKLTTVSITNTLNTLAIRAVVASEIPTGLEGF